MRDVQFGGFREVLGLQGLHDAAMPQMGLHRMEVGLIEHRNQDGPRRQVTQDVDEHDIAAQLRQPDMEIAHQAGQPPLVSGRNSLLLFGEMRAQFLAASNRQFAHAAKQAGFDDPPGGIDRHRLLGRRFNNEPAAAGADMDNGACFQPHHRLPHPRSRNAKECCQLVFTEAGAGLDASGKDAGDDGLLDITLRGLSCM